MILSRRLETRMGSSIQAFFINRSAPITVRIARPRRRGDQRGRLSTTERRRERAARALTPRAPPPRAASSRTATRRTSTIYHYFKEFAKAVDVNILAYDYTGYGKNRGVPSEAHAPTSSAGSTSSSAQDAPVRDRLRPLRRLGRDVPPRRSSRSRAPRPVR